MRGYFSEGVRGVLLLVWGIESMGWSITLYSFAAFRSSRMLVSVCADFLVPSLGAASHSRGYSRILCAILSPSTSDPMRVIAPHTSMCRLSNCT